MQRRIVILAVGLIAVLAAGARPDAARAQQPGFAPFAQGWGRHGFFLRVEADGTARASWRVYRWCHEEPRPPCDSIDDGEITGGGFARIEFFEADGDTAHGVVLESSDPDVIAYDLVTLTLLDFGMAMLEQDGLGIELCGDFFVDLAPPELLRSVPCGA